MKMFIMDFTIIQVSQWGLESLEDVTYLDDYEWEIVDEIGEHNLRIDLTSSYGFFSNGMGTYVVVDYKNKSE